MEETKYDNTNTGAIFKNENKEDGDKQPHYRGNINVDGKEKQIALWLCESKDGKKYLRAKISEPYKKGEVTNVVANPDEDDLPF